MKSNKRFLVNLLLKAQMILKQYKTQYVTKLSLN